MVDAASTKNITDYFFARIWIARDGWDWHHIPLSIWLGSGDDPFRLVRAQFLTNVVDARFVTKCVLSFLDAFVKLRNSICRCPVDLHLTNCLRGTIPSSDVQWRTMSISIFTYSILVCTSFDEAFFNLKPLRNSQTAWSTCTSRHKRHPNRNSTNIR